MDYISTLSPEEQEYDRRVSALEAQGMTRSDAQGVIDAQDMFPNYRPSL
jgi:hypothetical protein